MSCAHVRWSCLELDIYQLEGRSGLAALAQARGAQAAARSILHTHDHRNPEGAQGQGSQGTNHLYRVLNGLAKEY